MEEENLILQVKRDLKEDPKMVQLYLRSINLFITDNYEDCSDNFISSKLHEWVKDSIKG